MGCMLASSRFIRRDRTTSRSGRSATATSDAVWQRSLGMRQFVLYNNIYYDKIVIYYDKIVIDN